MSEWKCKRCGNCCKLTMFDAHPILLNHMKEWQSYFEGFEIELHAAEISAGGPVKPVFVIPRACKYYDEIIGCTRYDSRPEICRRYTCEDTPHMTLADVRGDSDYK